MRRDLFGALRALALPTLALVCVAVFAPGRVELAVRVYALIVATAVIVLALLALRRAYPTESPLLPPARPRARRVPPPSLVQLENEVALGVASSFDLHYRLVPHLRELASGLLGARRGTSLATEDTVRTILGDETWALVRPDRQAPSDRLARGLPADELAGVVDALERV
jgi:hypothetical protein